MQTVENYKKLASALINTNKYLSRVKFNYTKKPFILRVSNEKAIENWKLLSENQKQNCRELYNHVESNHFEFKDICIYAVKYFFFHTEQTELWTFQKINKDILDEIKGIHKEFEKDNYLKSIEKFENIVKKANTNYQDVFGINEGGYSYLYEMLMNNYIDLVLVVNLGEVFDDYVRKQNRDEKEIHREFRKAVMILNSIIKGE